jgi:putative acetyltransferase
MQGPYPSEAQWRKRLESVAEPGSVELHLVAELDGKVVGSAGLHVEHKALRRRHAVGLGIGIGKMGQGQGIGDALMKSLLNYADDWGGVLRVELTVWADNERAIRLYQKHGFAIEGRMRAYGLQRGRYVDALSMARLHPHPPSLFAS